MASTQCQTCKSQVKNEISKKTFNALGKSAEEITPLKSMEGTFQTESRPYDSTQEMRAMILAALPLPPLPVMVQRLDEDNRVCSETLQTSHDILSNLLIHACARDCQPENEKRKQKQMEILRSLLDHMCNRGQLQCAPDLYSTYCYHTKLHASTYIPSDGAMPAFRFADLASVCKGDYVHRKMCDYMAGQAIILDEPNGLSGQDWMCMEYADMLLITRGRLLAPPQSLKRARVEEPGAEEEGPAKQRASE